MFFKEQMKKRIKNEKGLTLIELLAVIVILGIVAAIAIPAIGNIIDNQRVKAVKADAANIISAAQIYYADSGSSDEFTIGHAADNTGTDYVDLAGATATGITVTSDGEISGTLVKNGKTLVLDDASLEEIEIDSTSKGAANTAYVITP